MEALKRFIWLVLLLFSSNAMAQTTRYAEPAANGYIRLFFDHKYYLVDKNCQYKSIERVAQFDDAKLQFDGPFKDFNSWGKLILEGHYLNGKKEGTFKAYHPNGQLKWEVDYKNNFPSGQWKYYYPDGKPMLVLYYDTLHNFTIQQYWNRAGEHKVVDGNGEYVIRAPIVGYTDQGFRSYSRSGKLANGKPHGVWFTHGQWRENETGALLFVERFKDGQQQSVYYEEPYVTEYLDEDDFSFIPTEHFPFAEVGQKHECNFDNYSGFLEYTKKKFSFLIESLPLERNHREMQIAVLYVVGKNGEPIDAKVVEEPQNLNTREKRRLIEIFESMNYFIPSMLDEEPIKDNITITLTLHQEDDEIVMTDFNLKREKGY